MYLSRVHLDLNRLQYDTLLNILAGQAYTAHQLLWRLFDDVQDHRPFLFRQEIESEQLADTRVKGLPLFYILSDRQPKTDLDWLKVKTKTFRPHLVVGQRLRFTLRANPTVDRFDKAQGRRRRSDVIMDAKFGYSGAQRRSAECK